MGIVNNTFKLTLVQQYSRIKVSNALLLLLFYMEAKSVPQEKMDKKLLTSVEIKFFRRTAVYTLFDHKSNEKIFEQLKVEPVEKQLRR
jgi:hypothetical protein